ncbi:LexA family transcriptional regulator [uncultured Lactobacillus sp.]|uniref:helix-turn-helix domain-containing protein n=1 Tax=uncultured Lactobacillus sp. TaxID=153152 RepID=UPI0025E10EED|nr:LexA family transcriptional regulator [uncultured Lactobacillus sp.]
MSLFETIKILAKRQGMTLLEVNDKAGLGKYSIYNWKTKTPKIDSIKKVAEALNTNVNDLINYSSANVKLIDKNNASQIVNVYPIGGDPTKIKDPNEVLSSASNNYQVRVPIISNKINSDNILSNETIIDYEDLTFNHKPNGFLYILKMQDDSMIPTIPVNSNLTVKLQSKVKNDEIAAVLIKNTVTIRRVRYINQTAFFMPDNRKYDLAIAKNKQTKIIGKVIHLDVNF